MSKIKRYAIVGTGNRSEMYSRALLSDFSEHGRLVAMCDTNPLRMSYWNRVFQQDYGIPELPVYAPDEFETMLEQEKVDTVIVTTVDRTHHAYICRAMRAGCDAITEKPMTVDESKCAEILRTIEETGRDLRVTFNYRYAPKNSKVKELLQEGVIGEVISVHFEWLLNTKHGADYFRRWHRDKRNSGGLMVHKATHHFDLVNWWLDSSPETVYAMGDLRFYGKENAEARGETQFYYRGTGEEAARGDPFALDLTGDGTDSKMYQLYYSAEKADGYMRDRSVFSDGISIEDDVAVMVKYQNRAVMSYHLTAYSPWEGYRVMFNGTQGRLEYQCVETPYVSGAEDDPNQAPSERGPEDEVDEPTSIMVHPLWGRLRLIEMPQSSEGGHGGGDVRLLRDIFVGSDPDPLGRAAGFDDGTRSILTGIAANQSLRTGLPVKTASLILNR